MKLCKAFDWWITPSCSFHFFSLSLLLQNHFLIVDSLSYHTLSPFDMSFMQKWESFAVFLHHLCTIQTNTAWLYGGGVGGRIIYDCAAFFFVSHLFIFHRLLDEHWAYGLHSTHIKRNNNKKKWKIIFHIFPSFTQRPTTITATRTERQNLVLSIPLPRSLYWRLLFDSMPKKCGTQKTTVDFEHVLTFKRC